jgi:hypothetical protein
MLKCIALFGLAILASSCTELPSQSEQQPQRCVLKSGECSPEELVVISREELQSAGDQLRVTCGITSVLNESFEKQCRTRIGSMIIQLSNEWPDFRVPAIPTGITLRSEQTCMDTFIPGREGADCEFVSVSATIAFVWQD